MSEFDSASDIPFQLKVEGEKITVRWQPGVPTQSTPGVPNSAQGTISWNIPSPARGCATIADGTSAYCGAIVVVSTKPLTKKEQPKNGTVYMGDNTVNPDQHTGDKIGDAMVVGVFYEGEKKANGEEMTVSMIVNDVDSKTPYYVGVYAADCQFRYHTSGAYAYSREYGNDPEADTPGYQVITLGSGVTLTDETPEAVCQAGVGSPPLYPINPLMFDLLISDTYPNITKDQCVHIEVEGNLCCTYDQLLFQIQKQLIAWTINRSELSEDVDPTNWSDPTPLFSQQGMSTTLIITGGLYCNVCLEGDCYDGDDTGTEPPNTGQYCWNAGTLQQFDGSDYHIVEGAFIEGEDPSIVDVGDYWYNPETQELKRDRVPNPNPPAVANGWNDVDVTFYTQDPTTLGDCDDFWFDGTQGYKWCTTTWCELETVVSTTDPTEVMPLDCTLIWYDEVAEQLKKWDPRHQVWEEISAIVWDVPPTNLTVGTFWFNDASSPQELRQWSVTGWSAPIAVTITDVEPTSPLPGMYWFNSETEELKERNGTNTSWTDLDVLVWPDDPTNTESCDKWWKPGAPDEMYMWDAVHNEWDLTVNFFISETSPFVPPTVELDTLWYNPDTSEMKIWTGSEWEPVNLIKDGDDPTLPSLGSAWYNPETNEWSVWGTPVANQWNAINPIDSTFDPKNFPTDGVVWFDTSTDILYVRDGGIWTVEPYVTDCRRPTRGTLWYDTDEGVLKEWDGTAWVVSYAVPVTVELNEDGHIQFTNTATGSSSVVMVIVPEGIPHEAATKTGYTCKDVTYTSLNFHSYAFYGPDGCPIGLDRLQECAATHGTTSENFLFGPNALSIAKILPQVHGFDNLSGTPSYLEQGVGTDGTSDERKALANYIRQQLGYPVVEVELTQDQLDNAVRRALDVFRQRSSLAYTRGFYFVDIIPGVQIYKLTSRVNGYNKIVNVMGVYRFTSAFLSTAHGAGVYGQVVLQHLYNMGTYDLTSYHLISQYIEQLEHLFATRLTFHWNEPTRELTLYNSFVRHERVLVEASVERTEQDIMMDRWSKNWIERWSLAEAQLVLARVRGKYASLPGAGGGVSLDAADLMSRAESEQERLLQELDDFVAQDIEDYGMGTTFVIG